MPAEARDGQAAERADERKLLRNGLKVLAIALIVVFLAAAIVTQIDALPKIDWSFDPPWLVASLLCLCTFQAIHAETWRRMLGALGYRLPWRRGWEIWNVSLLARYVPTQLLMVATRVAMSERDGVPRRITLASIVYEFLLAFGAALALSVSFIIGLPALQDEPLRWAVIAIPVLIALGLHPRLFDLAFTKIAARFGTEPLPEPLSVSQVFRYGCAYASSFVIAGVGVYTFARALHPIDGLNFGVILSVYAVAYASSVLAFFIPGGLGAREGATAAVLSAVVPFTVALATAVALRLVHTGVEIAYAGVSSLLSRGAPPAVVVESAARKADASASEPGVPIS